MSPFDTYLSTLSKALARGNATEHTHRPALQTLVQSFNPKITATNEPTREACGAPDYSVSTDTRHGPVTLGYIEAKDVGVDLAATERSDQLKRYRSGFHNLILTDYLEFRWYIDGQLRAAIRLADLVKGKLKPLEGSPVQLRTVIEGFLSQQPEEITSPKTLAERLAKLTHIIRDVIVAAFNAGKASATLTDLRTAFAQTLLPDLDTPAKTDEFADMYAQTIAYGLFAARCNHRGRSAFVRQMAAQEIPKTNPFLRQLFETITGAAMDTEPYAGLVDDLVALLNHTNIGKVLADFGKRTRREDPIVHFYETFLAAYDPKLRESRGVYYTPEPVVSYIVRSVDWLLKEKFNLPTGLADTSSVTYQRDSGRSDSHGVPITEPAQAPRVLILDPACGTGTFLYSVVDHIREQFMAGDNAGKWSPYVRTHLLPRLLGFELLMAPYAVAHLKLGMQLAAQDMKEALRDKWAYDFSSDDRLGVYLTNSLEEAERQVTTFFGPFRAITDEANAASRIKRDLPIMVVIGNPPYSGHSANKGAWIRSLIDTYKEGCHELRKPAQAKWLSDDYVKFIRFAQWRIERTGSGILAFVTNHSYLDNPTFRGMRRSLLETFDEAYILDLHGNAKKKETAPDGSPDKNVFDIQQGVAISLWVKHPSHAKKAGKLAAVRHADVFGERQTKYDRLAEENASTTRWHPLLPADPQYLLVPQDADLKADYDRYPSIRDIFSPNGDPAPGIVTTHDDFAISWTPEEAIAKVEKFLATSSEAEARELFTLCSTTQWNYERAKKELADGEWRNQIIPVLYRPFDVRFTVYDRNVAVHRRERVMTHMLGPARLSLISARSNKSPSPDHFICARLPSETKCGESTTQSHVFPLMLRAAVPQGELVLGDRTGDTPNLSQLVVEDVCRRTGLKYSAARSSSKAGFTPDDLFNSLYAVVFAPGYRTRYAQFLKTDYPRIPIPSKAALFRELSRLGSELVALHVLEARELGQPGVPFPTRGSNEVEKGYPRYLPPNSPTPGTGTPLASGRIYINKGNDPDSSRGQYFDNVPPEVWGFHVGGYQVCEKWLKDRRADAYGRALTFADIEHYQKVVAAIRETIRIMAEIDKTIDAHGGWPIR